MGALDAGRPAVAPSGLVSLAPWYLTSPLPLLCHCQAPAPAGARLQTTSRGAAGGANPESLEVSPSCGGTPWWWAEEPPLEAGGTLPTLLLLGSLLPSLPPLLSRGWGSQLRFPWV